MNKLLYAFSRWPWLVGLAVFAGLYQLPLGPWYVSAWFIVGASLFALIFARNTRVRLETELIARTPRHPRFGPLAARNGELYP